MIDPSEARPCKQSSPATATMGGDGPAMGMAMGLAMSLALLLGGCGGATNRGESLTRSNGPPDAVPRVEPKARYGNMRSYVVFGQTYYPKQSSRGYVERGIASWYGPKFHGRKTSSGERYDMHQMTAAHKTLPLPTYTLVKNLENGRSAVVKVNDRGPFVDDRIIDLSYAAAKKLGVDQKGTARVEVVSIDPRDHDGKVPKLRRVAAERHQQPRAATPLYVQVGAFGTRDNAEQLRRRLTGLLQDPVQVRAAGEGPASGAPRLYKVRVGPVASRSDADNLSRKLASLGIARPLLVSD
jgi:rare lipoprotein A